MRKHTPGPWEQKHQGMLCQIAINSDSDTLATVYGESGENLANARLIAAAPELLEALLRLRAAFVVVAGANSPFSKVALELPDAAILKAWGNL